MTIHIEVAALLLDVEAELRQLRQWQAEPPSAAALASSEPFCIDTLTFSQWLQFIFLPQMHTLSRQRSPLPQSCHIAPMAEEYFQPMGLNSSRLIAHLAAIDELLNEQR